MYHQSYNPTGNVALSTLVAAIPILTLLYFIALHPHRDRHGVRYLGISAPYAAFFGVIAAFLVACAAFGMPLASAASAFVLGTLSGFLGIIWIVLAAMFLYTMTVQTGKFEIVKESIVHISFDRRLQAVLIAFSFGAIIEADEKRRAYHREDARDDIRHEMELVRPGGPPLHERERSAGDQRRRPDLEHLLPRPALHLHERRHQPERHENRYERQLAARHRGKRHLIEAAGRGHRHYRRTERAPGDGRRVRQQVQHGGLERPEAQAHHHRPGD